MPFPGRKIPLLGGGGRLTAAAVCSEEDCLHTTDVVYRHGEDVDVYGDDRDER